MHDPLTPLQLYAFAGAFGFGCGFLTGVLAVLSCIKRK
jgi:hypothetical protein